MQGMDRFVSELLEEKYLAYAKPEFLLDDPIQLPHRFSKKPDQEVIGFLAATLAWGQRKTIIKNGERLLVLMENEPHGFTMSASDKELDACASFVHRTFNGDDLITFILALRRLFQEYGSIENAFFSGPVLDMGQTISRFKERFFEVNHAERTRKHVADPMKGSSAKRLNMYMRWMSRPSNSGVDLGIWSAEIIPRLHVPLDVHTGRTARALGLLTRKQNDWKAVVGLTESLREIDPKDPCRFDIPLFAIGVHEPELLTGQ